LVSARDDKAMAAAARRLLSDPELAARLSSAGLVEVQKYTWPRVRAQWRAVYSAASSGSRVQAPMA
ncbi:MAG: glycosyltransferase family 1 protein, partial [Terriglobia bacterium]